MKNIFSKFIKYIPVLSLGFLLPIFADAQTSVCAGITGLSSIICKVNELMTALLPMLISLGVLLFIWGIVQFMIADTEEAKTKGRDTIVYGIIGLAVILSIWGLVKLVTDTLGLNNALPDVSKTLVVQGTTSGCTAISSTSNIAGVLGFFTCTIAGTIIPFIFALAVLMFIWGVVKFFLINGDEEKQREEGKQFILWGIISLAVMISIWGLVNLLGNTFGISTTVLPTVKP